MEIKPSCKASIKKLCQKNPVLRKAITNKIKQIIENPMRFKPLSHGLAGQRRVHIQKSFVLKYTIAETEKIIIFLFFGHHDEAYKR